MREIYIESVVVIDVRYPLPSGAGSDSVHSEPEYDLQVTPHVGDMGQIHQSLALFDRIALNAPVVFLEHIPHLRSHFVDPAVADHGVYRTPQASGCACDLMEVENQS
ncbi:MAG: hypothetical protein ABI165_01385 [Bryobacteraceae bacterium]